MNKYLDIAPEVRKALDEGKPGRRPGIDDYLLWHALSAKCGNGAECGKDYTRKRRGWPATIAIIGGRLKAD